MLKIVVQYFILCASFILSNSQYYTRVLNGSPALIQEYPVIAQMLLDAWDDGRYEQYCAGVILTARNVISTAHCFDYREDVRRNFTLPQYWQVRVGSSYRSHGGVIHKVKKIIKHYGFDKYYYMNDIAVVVVAKKIMFSQYVGQATIIKEGTDLPENSVCTLIGWGATYRDGPQPDQLQFTNSLLTIDNDECKMMYSTIGAVISTSMLCAGRTDVDGIDGCLGDSGGPLLYKGVVVGLVSFGYSCGLRMYPGVYTKISHYTDWIIKTITTNK